MTLSFVVFVTPLKPLRGKSLYRHAVPFQDGLQFGTHLAFALHALLNVVTAVPRHLAECHDAVQSRGWHRFEFYGFHVLLFVLALSCFMCLDKAYIITSE